VDFRGFCFTPLSSPLLFYPQNFASSTGSLDPSAPRKEINLVSREMHKKIEASQHFKFLFSCEVPFPFAIPLGKVLLVNGFPIGGRS